MNNKNVDPVVKAVLLVATIILFLYSYYSRKTIYEGAYLGNPVFVAGQDAPTFDRATMAAVDDSRIYLMHCNSGILDIYTLDGEHVGYYAFYLEPNGQFSVYCRDNTLYVFDKGHNLYMLEELELTSFLSSKEANGLERELEHMPGDAACRVNTRGVWLRSETGYVLVIPTPGIHAANIIRVAFFFGCIALIIIFAIMRGKWKVDRIV